MDALKKYLPWAPIALGVVALIMIFCPAIAVDSETYSGLDIAFGCEEYGVQQFEFSIMNLLTYVFVIGGAVCAYLAMKKNDIKMVYIAIGCFVLAAIFFFCTVAFSSIGKEILEYGEYAGMSKGELAKELKAEFDLGIGSIIGAICSLLAAGCLAYPVFVKKN